MLLPPKKTVKKKIKSLKDPKEKMIHKKKKVAVTTTTTIEILSIIHIQIRIKKKTHIVVILNNSHLIIATKTIKMPVPMNKDLPC